MSNEFCRYFIRGTCRFGEYCRFAHTLPTTTNTSSSSNNSNSININKNNSREQQHLENIDNISTTTLATDPKPLLSSTTVDRSELSSSSQSSQQSAAPASSTNINPVSSWVLAPVFVPRQQQKQDHTSTELENIVTNMDCAASTSTFEEMVAEAEAEGASASKSYAQVAGSAGHIVLDHKSPDLCPFEMYCTYGEYCVYQHGELCDMCGRYLLHPTDKEQRRKHINDCIQQHEKDMEMSFAIARSKDKTCGICFDVILEKTGRQQRFGILPNCNHIFCLSCIRKWRQAKQFESKITRACPECRTPSDFVCPSPYWVDTKEDKEKLIEAYKVALNRKDCKYFKKGEGKCPFGNRCFYKHALPNGQLIDVGVPQKARKIQRSDEEILELFDQVFPQIYLWDFVDRRDFISRALSESEDSDWSDDDFFA